MTYLVDLMIYMNKQYHLGREVNNINLFIYIMTRALQDTPFSEYLLFKHYEHYIFASILYF